MLYSVSGHPPYPEMDWKSIDGIIYPVVISLVTILIFYVLEFVNYKKLMKYNKKNSVILNILNKKKYILS